MKHLATYMLLQLGGTEKPTKDQITSALSSVGVEVDEDKLDVLFEKLAGGKTIDELMAEGKKQLAQFGSSDGSGEETGVDAAAAGQGHDAIEPAAKQDEVPIDDDVGIDIGGGLGIFDGDEGGTGDY